ncbi:MAG: hypothetical protein PHN72_05425 [Bacilli bacterium]|nr:hypothetical protein [Bacilli bacterium]
MSKKDLLDTEFDNFKETAYRICALPYYDCGETEEVQKYMQGFPMGEDSNKEWRADVKTWTSEGKKIIRIIVLPAKQTDYNKWMLRIAELNTLAGEEIYYLDEAKYDELLKGENSSDFWIFDNERVSKMFYDDKNDYINSDLIASDTQKYIDLFWLLQKNSTPLYEVLKKTRENLKVIL